MKKTAFLIAGMVLAGTIASQAQAPAPRMNGKQFRQQERIRHGFRSGDLTLHEARHLKRQQRNIHRAKRNAGRDGIVGPLERKHIHKMQRRSNRHIYRHRHNAVRRPAF